MGAGRRGKTTDFSPSDGATLVPSRDERVKGEVDSNWVGGLFLKLMYISSRPLSYEIAEE
jgi:hypothetical protein